VIAIIAILAAILFPVFARAKEAAKQATCLSNLKQIGTGIHLYMSDFDDGFPNTGIVGLWAGRRFRWPIMPYLGLGQTETATGSYNTTSSSPLLYCPTDATKGNFNDTSYAYVSSLYRDPAVLATLQNLDLIGSAPCGNLCRTVYGTEVALPASKVMVFEWINSHNYGKTGPTGPWGITGPGFSPGPGRFEGRRNSVFVDGHAKNYAASQYAVSHLNTPDPNLTPGGFTGSDLK
jgi:prepilin-type processing-associated H-X9-DG protein